jgi:hypothetical protein
MRIGISAIIALSCLLGSAPVQAATLLGVDYDTGKLYEVNQSTAGLTLIGNTGVPHFAEIEFAPSGSLWGFTTGATSRLYKIDPTTAAVINVGPLGIFAFEGGLAFDPNGVAYGLGAGSASQPRLFTINLSTGATTLGPLLSGGAHDINGLSFRSDGKLVGLDRISGGVVTIDPTTGVTSLLASIVTNIGADGGMAANSSVGFLSTSAPGDIIPGSNQLYQFNPSTGATSLVGTFPIFLTGTGISGLAITPEPGTLVLAGVSMLLATARFTRRGFRRSHPV